MRLPLRALVLVALVALVIERAPAVTADPPTHETGYIPVAVGTPDETTLHYKVMLPDAEVWGPGPYPAVIDYSGYLPAQTVYDGLDDRFVAAGYAVVGLNIRGSGCSGGKFDYFEPRQSIDGVEAIDWLAERPWSNGEFGMVGKSYPGITQLFVAGAHSDDPAEQARLDGILADHLKAIVPGHVFGDLYRDVPFPGGILNATFASAWPAQRLNESYVAGTQWGIDQGDDQCLANQQDHAANVVWNPLVQGLPNQYDAPFFQTRSPWYFAHEIETPMFLMESWQDEQVGSRATHLLERVRPDLPWRFLATNGDHGEYYGDAVFPHILRFLSYHLKHEVPAGDQLAPPATTTTTTVPSPGPGTGKGKSKGNGKGDDGPVDEPSEPTFDEALARYLAEDRVIINWETGAGGGRTPAWTDTYATWPPPELATWRLNLRDDGSLTDAAAPPAPPPLSETAVLDGVNARLSYGPVDYAYAPTVGSQQRGGFSLVGEPELASWDDRPAPGTAASFTTPPLDADKVLLGSASLDLWVASTAPDTDFEVTLSEVRPDGQEVFVQQGWLRASHRLEDSALSTPLRPYQTHRVGDVTPLIPGQPTKARVEIFPFGHVFRAGSQLRIAVAAPHQKPDLWGFAALPAPAVNTIFTAGPYQSSLALPLVDGATAQAPLPPCTLRNQPCRAET